MYICHRFYLIEIHITVILLFKRHKSISGNATKKTFIMTPMVYNACIYTYSVIYSCWNWGTDVHINLGQNAQRASKPIAHQQKNPATVTGIARGVSAATC